MTRFTVWFCINAEETGFSRSPINFPAPSETDAAQHLVTHYGDDLAHCHHANVIWRAEDHVRVIEGGKG